MRLLGGQLGSAPLQLWLFAHRLFLRRGKNFEKTLAVLFFVAIIRQTSIMEATRDGEFEMTKQKMRSALLFLAGSLLAAGAWGQTVTLVQSVDYRLNVASEFFGDPDGRTVVTLDSDATRTAAVQIVISGTGAGTAPDQAGTLEARNKAYLTFTLTGATFSGAINTNSLKLQRGGVDQGNIVKTITEGGSAGDREVTFELEVVEDFLTVTSGLERLLFEVPSLTVDPVTLKAAVAATATDPAMPAVEGVRVDAAIRPFASRSNPFPGQVTSATPVANAATTTKSLADAQIISLHSALGASLGPGEVANVAIDNLKAIADGTNVTLTSTTKTRGVRVGSLIVSLTDPEATGVGFDPTQSDQSDLLVLAGNATTRAANGTVSPSLAGNLRVRVSGDFQEGDRVVLGADQTDAAAKAFTPDGESMMVEVPLSTSIAAPGTPVVYIPGGVDNLTPRKFDASLELRLLDPRSRSGPAGRPTEGEIRYKDITAQGYAYGVVRSGGIESSFIRMGCLRSGGCSVYMTCYDQAGTSYFGGIGDPINNNATMVLDSDEIAEALGGEGWTSGRGRCDFMSNGKLEIQHMVRTGGGQVNNSLVIDEGGIKN